MILGLRAAGHESFSRAALMKAAPANLKTKLGRKFGSNLEYIGETGAFCGPPGGAPQAFLAYD
jgi:hypothetical protein